MAVLLDTVLLYELMKDPSVKGKYRRRFERDREDVFVSVASLWEMRLKYQARRASGERKSPYDPERVLRVLRAIGIEVIPITPADATRPLAPPLDHQDPFDELLLSQAQQRNLKLATTDEKLLEHPSGIRF